MLWIIVIIIIIIIVILILLRYISFWFLQSDNILNSEDISHDQEFPLPTIHNRCDIDKPCGGDLVCDLKCKRCRKSLNGDCSSDIDCDSGLRCFNWKCSPIQKINSSNNESSDLIKQKKSNKFVRWNDENNQTHYFSK